MKMMLCNLPADGEMPEIFTRGRMSLGFWLNGSVARLVVEYEYYLASGAIRYVDVRYTDSQLQSRVENDRAMMKNIDNYLRRMLKQEQSA